jgi:DMSO/TMAO reductase YedYZ molybdopterin-dependent catalytic subunit
MDTPDDRTADRSIPRRAFLGGAALAAVPVAAAAVPSLAAAQDPPTRPARGFPGLISRQRGPDNLEFPFPTLDSFITPTAQFFVRNHFDVPDVDVKTWRIRVEGVVDKPFNIGSEELRNLPSRTITATLECAGNGRVFLRPPQVGVRWEQGAVSNAEWTGVPLATLLQRAGVRDGAVEVILEGADRGEYRDPLPRTPGVIPFARSLPITKARLQDVLVAYRMNGQNLTPAHGLPARVVVPGWYGMASVKWLRRILVIDQPFRGYFQTFAYTIWQRRAGLADLAQIGEMQVKAQIARPTLAEVVPAGAKYRVFGAAWTGEAEVTAVDVSTDGGTRWSPARLLDKAVRHSWRLWEYEWAVPQQPGRHILMARATDSQKRVQPIQRDDDRRDSMISHVQRIEVEVR